MCSRKSHFLKKIRNEGRALCLQEMQAYGGCEDRVKVLFGFSFGVSKITCGFSKINCGMESWANGNSPKSVVGRNRWILNKKMVKKSGNRVTFGCLIWYKTYFLYYLNFGPFTACFLYGPLVLSVRKQTSFHGLGTAKMAAFFRCEKRKRFRICSKFP